MSVSAQFLQTVFAALVIMAAGCRNFHHETGIQSADLISVHQLKNLISIQTNKVVFVHFWATGCAPCMEELPSMITLADKWDGHGATVLFVSVDSRQNVAAVNNYLAKHHMRHSCYVADNLNDAFINDISPQWSGALPASFFFASDGTIMEWWEGTRPYATYELAMQDLVRAQPKPGVEP
jgi:thiol-disulfide isomerase/thioredoxin